VSKLTYDYEKAKLNELLGSMQQVVKKLDEKADNDGQTPERLVTKPVEKQMPKVE
jgi:hypothetical protein